MSVEIKNVVLLLKINVFLCVHRSFLSCINENMDVLDLCIYCRVAKYCVDLLQQNNSGFLTSTKH